MKNYSIKLITLFLIAVGCNQNKPVQSDVVAVTQKKTRISGDAELAGANILAFGPDNVLFIGDSKGAKVLAVQTEAQVLIDPGPYYLVGVDTLVAE